MKFGLKQMWEKILTARSSNVALWLYVAVLPLVIVCAVEQKTLFRAALVSGLLGLLVEMLVTVHRSRRPISDGKRKPAITIVPGEGVRKVGRAIFSFIEERSREHIVGDLEEEYVTAVVPTRGYIKARCWWWRQMAGIVGPYIWKRMRRLLGLEAMRGLRRR